MRGGGDIGEIEKHKKNWGTIEKYKKHIKRLGK